MHTLEWGATELHCSSADTLPARRKKTRTRTWAPSVNVPREGFRARRTGRLHSRAGGMKENDAAQRQARQRTPPARRAGAVRRLRREAARTGETTASGAGDDGVMYRDKAAAGCDLTTLRFLFALGFGVVA